jgi:hypothetical protein
MTEDYKNPFEILTPEGLSSKEAVELFVDVFSDFYQIVGIGHVFIKSPRGSGKSMMFRYLQPDCQCLARQCTIQDLKFLGVYIPLKNSSFTLLPELRRLEGQYADMVMNEHLMVLHFAIMFFENIYKGNNFFSDIDIETAINYYRLFSHMLNSKKRKKNNVESKLKTFDAIIQEIKNALEKKYKEAFQYVKKLAFINELPIYQGDLLDYLGFLIPLMSGFLKMANLSEKTIYLLVDDAHCLTEIQAKILNTWVSTRTTKEVSLKISTQYSYKSYYTITGGTIDSPHDYSEIDISSIYTSKNKSMYRKRIVDIVTKRFQIHNVLVSAEDFFPEDREQAEKISKIEKQYIDKYNKGQSKGYNRTDDAFRYARPDYIKSLSGTSKNSPSYSYSGFNQLVHLSSGVVRFFLEPAHHMYARELAKNIGFKEISPGIQSEISKEEAVKFLFEDLNKLKRGSNSNPIPETDINRLSKLIQGLGGLFRQILLSDRSERRVFSIAFSDEPSELTTRILNLGIELGYFQKSTIGRKDSESGGRTTLYVLNRRLAPIWTLDPTGFAGYLFVTNKIIEDAMEKPFLLLNRIRRTKLFKENDDLTLFDESEYSPIQVLEGDTDENI